MLIPGTEARGEGKNVILLNVPKEDAKIKTCAAVKDCKKKHPESFIMAPHPFYPKNISSRKQFLKNIDLFDWVEYSHCYLGYFNGFNKKAVKYARKYNLPVIGTSDAHQICQFNKTCSFVDADKDINSVLNALRENKIKINTKPLSSLLLPKLFYPMIIKRFSKLFKRAHSKSRVIQA